MGRRSRRLKPRSAAGRVFRGILFWAAMAVSAMIAFSSVQVFLAGLVNTPFTVAMLIEWRAGSEPFPWVGLRATWRPLDHISPELRRAVLAGEDQRFLAHRGFDTIEMRVVLRDAVAGEGVRGASTITMQTARTLFLTNARSYWRKAAEAWYSLLMELMWSKARILEVYLNSVDWGPAGRGAERAGRHYFNASAEQLSRSQAAMLAAMLPNPHRWSPASPDETLLRRQRHILTQMDRVPLVD